MTQNIPIMCYWYRGQTDWLTENMHQNVLHSIMSWGHGLQTPNAAFFIEIPNFWAWADKVGR